MAIDKTTEERWEKEDKKRMTPKEKQSIKSILNVIGDKIKDGIDNIQGGDLWQAETELNDAQYWLGEAVGELNEMKND